MIWMNEEPISIIKTPPIIGKANALPKIKPMTAKVAPNDNDPVSPKKILAGNILKYKNAINPPNQAAINNEVGTSRIVREITQNPIKVKIKIPLANPSNPSVILTALAKAIITKVENKI
ncbi:MAG: hypothetical protein UR54_C0022G0008 [Candidatus Roizmanbacteria bacterium GW2011_GWA2_34_18]|uniref:Uncharacterized protein n=1 Tax=Candidatus Roizmanbacteria bacterium GW2011_GWA2_34_18 TaxID=1618477 RepID=A0A0G0AS63_9BACT|nr:MAG: hypothetical protein UR54_C0022G0008 [Candidatus Roizmanbacteria bacterium GW2011_GWA2_34_18]